MEGTLGEIRMFSGDFAPEGWAFCIGQRLSVTGNLALFSVIRNYYGGDGDAFFNLPDFRCGFPVGAVGVKDTEDAEFTYLLGQSTSGNLTQLDRAHMPEHSHDNVLEGYFEVNFPAYNGLGTSAEPEGTIPAILENVNAYSTKREGGYYMASDTVSALVNPENTYPFTREGTLSTAAFDVTPPFLAMHYIICVESSNYPER